MNADIQPESIFDRKSALQRLQGDSELLAEVIEIFLKTSPRKMEEIREALRTSNAPQVAQSAHALKSSVGNFSATRTHEAAWQLESLGRAGDLAEAEAAVKILEQELEYLSLALEEALHSEIGS